MKLGFSVLLQLDAFFFIFDFMGAEMADSLFNSINSIFFSNPTVNYISKTSKVFPHVCSNSVLFFFF